MEEQYGYQYARIAEAITYIERNFRQQPDLEEIAAQVHMSPFHFQRMFSEWAGVSPKKFLQYVSLQYAKRMLTEKDISLFETAVDTGLSGTGRLHDLFVRIEAMTPGEYKNGGKDLFIHYSFAITPFGQVLIASTAKGICWLTFTEDQNAELHCLMARFPEAKFSPGQDQHQRDALGIFSHSTKPPAPVHLHLKGSPFQLKVWESLLKIPMGRLSTYGHVAELVGAPNASRAVGTAIGKNPVAYLIPCHRIIRSTGALGGYMWGETRKRAITGWEAARVGD